MVRPRSASSSHAGSRPAEGDPLAAGKADPPGRLLALLPTAGARYLEGSLENPALDEDLAVVLLRNRGAPSAVLRRLHGSALGSCYRVQAALAGHPRAPRAIALRLTHLLRWRDLANLADSWQAPPPVRRLAVQVLGERLDEMALGEQIALARTGGHSVLLALRRVREEAVAQAFLANPRLREEDVVAMAGARDTPPRVLSAIAAHRQWMLRHAVRVALIHNPGAPVGIVLGLLTVLPRRELEGLASRADHPPVVRLAAARVLDSRAHPTGGTAPPGILGGLRSSDRE